MTYSPDHSSSEEQETTKWVQKYESALEQGSSFFFETDAFQEIIDYYDEHLNTEKALVAIEYALQQHPYCAQFYLSKAQIYMDEERYDDATEALDTAKCYEPTNIELLLAEADLLHRRSQFPQAMELLAQVRLMGDENDWVEADILEANMLEAQQKYAEALKKLEQAVARDPENDWLLSRVWLCAEWGEQREQAIQIYLRVIDNNPYSFWAWYHLGYAYNELEQYEQAVEAFDYAIVIDESFELPYRDIVSALIQLEWYDDALRYLHDYSNRFEPDAEIYEFMGECYEGKGDSVQARSFYVQSVQMNARDGNSYFRLGGCYAKEQNWKSALSSFELAAQTDTTNENYSLAVAEAQYELKNNEQAEAFLVLATQQNPMSAHVWGCYTEFLIYEQKFDMALQVLEQARLVCTDGFALDCAEVAVLFHAGKHQACWLLLMQLVAQNPDAPKRIIEISTDIADHPLWQSWMAAL